jgi:DNA-binding CsgD family transcriptional regulator
VGQIHKAATAPDRWPEALATISQCFDRAKVCMFRIDLQRGSVHELRTHDIDAQACDDYANYYHQVDPWLNAYDPAWPARQALLCSEIVPDRVVRRTEFYNDFIKHLDMRFALSGLPTRSSRSIDILTLFKGVDGEDFDQDAIDTYQLLLEQAGQALEMQRSLGRLKGLSRGLATALEHVAQPTLLLGRDAWVMHANSAAVDMLYSADGIALTEGRLEAAQPDANDALGALVRKAFEDLENRKVLKRRIVAIPRPSGRRPYLVRVYPIDQSLESIDMSDLPQDPHLVMTITDPEASDSGPKPESLQLAYGLTPAEASLAAALARGETLAQVAARKNIAVASARKQLQSIFEKTGTHRQAELVRRVMGDG